MSNCVSSLGVVHAVVDTTIEKEVMEFLTACLDHDLDLSENEDYFREDTIELGFENEVKRIIEEARQNDILENPNSNQMETFKSLTAKVVKVIDEQEYFGGCELSIIELDSDRVSAVFTYGGIDE
jgi:hypothetical protein